MKKRKEAEWRKLTTEYQNSSQTQIEWCKTKGINLHTFRSRLSKVRKLATTKSKKGVAETMKVLKQTIPRYNLFDDYACLQ